MARPVLLLASVAGSLVAFAPSALSAQTVVGRVLEGEAAMPVEGALVVLVRAPDEGASADGEVADGAITDRTGRFVLNAPGAGRYRLRAERIGLETVTSSAFDLVAGQAAVSRDLVTTPRAFELEGLEVAGGRRCTVRPSDGLAVATLWDDARKALNNQLWSERANATRFHLVQVERELGLSGRLVVDESRGRPRWTNGVPVRSLPASDLVKGGFVREAADGGYIYHGPDAEALLSDAFLDAYCFRLADDPPEPGLVGLAFEPVRRRDVADITGTLWLDAADARLRYLEFGYTWAPWVEARGAARGRVEFEELESGTWIIRRWWIRMPKMMQDRTATDRFASGLRLVGLAETGGEVVRIETAAGADQPRRRAGSITGEVRDSVDGRPLPDAEVYLSGTSHATRTDSAGRFRLDDVAPGSYQVAFHHSALDAAGIYPAAVSTPVRADQVATLSMAGPKRGEALAALCPAPIEEGTGAVAGTVRARGPEGTVSGPFRGARVTAEWTDYRIVPGGDVRADVTTLEMVTGPTGRFRFCDVPPAVRLTLRAAPADGPAAAAGLRRTVTTILNDLVVVDLTLGSSHR